MIINICIHSEHDQPAHGFHFIKYRRTLRQQDQGIKLKVNLRSQYLHFHHRLKNNYVKNTHFNKRLQQAQIFTMFVLMGI